MCGRYTLNLRAETFADVYGVQAPLDFAPRYNIAPTQAAPILRLDQAGMLEAVNLRWGFPAVQGKPLINARSETVQQKPSFAAAFFARRALVPATGYYEWALRSGHKQPYLLHLEHQAPLAFAGLWTRDHDEQPCFTVLTAAASDATRAIHDRQPVILEPQAWQTWLAPETPRQALEAMLHADERLLAYPVSLRVGHVGNDDAGLLEPLPVMRDLFD